MVYASRPGARAASIGTCRAGDFRVSVRKRVICCVMRLCMETPNWVSLSKRRLFGGAFAAPGSPHIPRSRSLRARRRRRLLHHRLPLSSSPFSSSRSISRLSLLSFFLSKEFWSFFFVGIFTQKKTKKKKKRKSESNNKE